MGVARLATADKPDAKAWAPVPAKLEAIATVRGKSLLVFTTGLQLTFAQARPWNW
jgi:hypothetical protein